MIDFIIATPLVGSHLLKICIQNKFLRNSYLNCNFGKAIIETADFTAEYIQEISYSLNLEINFVENIDIKRGQYDVALQGFENTIKSNAYHAFAYYYAGECYRKLGQLMKAYTSKIMARNLINEYPFWAKYARRFGIR